MNIENNIVKLFCGTEQGTALLIDSQHAITVYHCVESAYKDDSVPITLEIMVDGRGKKVQASLCTIEDGSSNRSALAYVQLNETVNNICAVKFNSCILSTFQEIHMFGYGKNRPVGSWMQLKSTGPSGIIEGKVCDLQLDTVDTKDKTFSGFSGSPLLDKEHSYILGFISQEDIVGGEAIFIEGISVKSQVDFFNKFNIPVESLKIAERNIDGKPTTVQTVNFEVIGSSDRVCELYNTILNDIVLMHHKGYRMEARNKLREHIHKQQNDNFLSNGIKAQFLLQQAIWELEDNHNISVANKSYEKATQYDKSLDSRIFLALRAFYLGNGEAKELLEPIDSLQMLNTYLQICVNQNNGMAAVKAYTTYKDIYELDENTRYLLAIAYLLCRDFLTAQDFINQAINENGDVADYYLIRALIKYWKTVPQEAFVLSDGFYPPLYNNGFYFFTDDMRIELEDLIADFKLAYNKAEFLKDERKAEMILTCWVNAVSIDNILFSKIEEPLELLRVKNPNHVVVLMIDVLCNQVEENKAYEKQLRILIKKKNNSIGYILILTEYYFKIMEKNKAKSLLYEYRQVFENTSSLRYWYDHIAKVEDNEENRKVIVSMIKKDDSLTDEERKRILCLFESFSIENVLQQLESLYENTGATLDIMNIIWYCQKNEIWDKVLEYAQILNEKHHNPYGYIFQIKTYMKMHSYNEAYMCIEKIEQLNLDELNRQIQVDKLSILEKRGEYSKAISVGEELFNINPTESVAHKLANLYIKKGSKSDAIQVLQTVERKKPLSSIGYQRLSGYYRHIDVQKSLEYAEKYVNTSKRSPEALSWAATNAANMGMSGKMGTYWKELLECYPNSSNLKDVSIEELLDMVKSERIHRQECVEKYNKAEIPLHVLLDGVDNTIMSEIFYTYWSDANHISMLFFGGHYIDIRSTNFDKIVLDYTSCLLLHELKMLEILATKVSVIYIPAKINPVIMEEQDKLCSGQSDLLRHKRDVMDYCINTLHLQCVEHILPDNLSNIAITEHADVICAYTAKENEATWIDIDRDCDYMVSDNEVYAAISSKGVTCDYDKSKVRREKLDLLNGQGVRLLIGILALEEFYDKGILEDLCEMYEIILFDEERYSIEQEWINQNTRHNISDKLESLKNTLVKLNDMGKLKWGVEIEHEYSDRMYCDLLISAMETAIKNNIPYCVEDRCMQSYGHINHIAIYSALDIITVMHHNKWIEDINYINVYRELINRKIGFIIPDAQLIFQELQRSSIRQEKLVENKKLLSIKTYMEQSFYLLEKYSGIYGTGNHSVERKCYCALHFMHIKVILEKIWQSDMELDKKWICSDWIILQYSRIGETLPVLNYMGLSIDNSVVFTIVQLICLGMFFTLNINLIPQYSEWLSSLILYNLDDNVTLLNEVVDSLLHEIHIILTDTVKNNPQMQFIFERSISNVINYMPECLRLKILADHEISSTYEKFFENAVYLSDGCFIPYNVFDEWRNESLRGNENDELIKEYNNVKFKISWKYIMPLWPLYNIYWKGKTQSSYQLYGKPGERLFHSDVSVRINEARQAYKYLDCNVDMEMIEQISTEDYIHSANMLNKKIRINESYIEEQIQLLVKEKWICEISAIEYFLPGEVSYFKQFYDYDSLYLCDNQEILLSIPINLQEGYNCERSLNPVRCLHYLSWILHNNFNHDSNSLNCMFEFMEGGCNHKYGLIYIALLKLVFKAMEEFETYALQPIQNRIIWTYVWVDKIYDEMVKWIQMSDDLLDEYQKDLCECVKKFVANSKNSTNLENYDVIDPSQMGIMRLCFLGSIELFLNLDWENQDVEMGSILQVIERNITIWLKVDGASLEFFLSHEQTKNEWNTFFAANYRKEWNKILRRARDISKEELFPENNILELQRILQQDTMSPMDKSMIILECLKQPDGETVILLKSILQKFYLDTDIMIKAEDYDLPEIVLSRLPEKYSDQFRKDVILKLKNRLLIDINSWKEIFGCLLWIVGENYELCIEFWEMVAKELESSLDSECISWLTRLQLILPAELGQRVYNAKIKIINKQFKSILYE